MQKESFFIIEKNFKNRKCPALAKLENRLLPYRHEVRDGEDDAGGHELGKGGLVAPVDRLLEDDGQVPDRLGKAAGLEQLLGKVLEGLRQPQLYGVADLEGEAGEGRVTPCQV